MATTAVVVSQQSQAGEFEITGLTDFNGVNIEDQLSVYPQFFEGFNAIDSTFSSSQSLSLRGLGGTRTVVLVDGNRIGWFGDIGIFDPNALPASFIDHVVVDTGGGSSAYGSGAVAGSVNLVLKRNLDGLEISASNKFAIPGDHANLLNVYAGVGTDFLDDRANVTVLGNFTRSEKFKTGRYSVAGLSTVELSEGHTIFLDTTYTKRDMDETLSLTQKTSNFSISAGAHGDAEHGLSYDANITYSRMSREARSDIFSPLFLSSMSATDIDHLQARLSLAQRIDILKTPWSGAAPKLHFGAEIRDLGFGSNGKTVSEVFSAFDYPLVKSDSFLRELSLGGGYRFSHYSKGVGGVNSYRASGSVTFAPGITLDGAYQRNHLAPSIAELFTPTSSNGFPGAIDPCAPGGFTPVTLVSTCMAAGIPTGNSQIQPIVGGNPNLAHETADTITFGMELMPDFVGGLSMRFEYYHTEHNNPNGIGFISLQTILDECHLQNIVAQCAIISAGRTSGGFLDLSSLNHTSTSHTPGIELQAGYTFDVPFGSFSFDYFGGRLLQTTFQVSENSVATNCFQNTCGNIIPKYNHTLSARYQAGPIGANVRWRRIGGIDFRDDTFAVFGLITDISAKPANYLDAAIHADITDELRITIGGRNLFDKRRDIPLLGSTVSENPSNPFVFENLGRRLFADVSMRF